MRLHALDRRAEPLGSAGGGRCPLRQGWWTALLRSMWDVTIEVRCTPAKPDSRGRKTADLAKELRAVTSLERLSNAREAVPLFDGGRL
jgi:hypothetical protein